MHHPRFAAAVAGRDAQRLAEALTESVRLRALLPGGLVESRGRADVVARFQGWFADFDGVELAESAAAPVADRLLIHYRLHMRRGTTRWVCTQTAVCKVVNGLLATMDLVCSGFREVNDDEHARALPGARLVG
jgi:hypothetical protein